MDNTTLTNYINRAKADKELADKALDKMDWEKSRADWDKMYDRTQRRDAGVKRAEEKLHGVNTSFTKHLVTILRQKYPDATFDESPGMEVSSADGELKVVGYEEVEGNKIGVFIGDAVTGKYTGAVKPAIAATIAALQKIHPKKKPVLMVDGDESDGVWSHVAKELNLKLVNLSDE